MIIPDNTDGNGSERSGQMEDVMTLKQVADYFKISEITVHRLTQKGILPGVKIGRQWRYFRQNVERIVRHPAAFRRMLRQRRMRKGTV